MYHSGELETQTRAGVQNQARRVGSIIGAKMPLAAQEFLRRQPFAVLTSVDVQGRVWVSVIHGKPGFMEAIDEKIIKINGESSDYDLLGRNLQGNPGVGMLTIDLFARRRMRVNGKGILRDDRVTLYTEQVYSNCQKYIQAREWAHVPERMTQAIVHRSDVLNMVQQSWIKQADTFFIGSFHPQGGADASHRGGNPGFIKILDEKTLLWPDYIGNNMFNTLGNIAVYPDAGLLFIDFDSGATLQLTGVAEVIWDTEHAVECPGAQRLVQFSLATVVETRDALPLRWKFDNYSQFNPGLQCSDA